MLNHVHQTNLYNSQLFNRFGFFQYFLHLFRLQHKIDGNAQKTTATKDACIAQGAHLLNTCAPVVAGQACCQPDRPRRKTTKNQINVQQIKYKGPQSHVKTRSCQTLVEFISTDERKPNQFSAHIDCGRRSGSTSSSRGCFAQCFVPRQRCTRWRSRLCTGIGADSRFDLAGRTHAGAKRFGGRAAAQGQSRNSPYSDYFFIGLRQ